VAADCSHAKKVRIIYEPTYFHNADVTILKVYDLPVIQQAFNRISNSFDIEFNYPQGGCQQRAHVMSMILDKKFNIEHCKLWLFAPAAMDMNETLTLFIADKNGLSPSGIIEWNYHVVPVMQVQAANAIDTLVIDPSINRNEPMTMEAWFNSIGNSDTGKYSFLLPDKYFFNCFYSGNEMTSIFDGSFVDFINQAKDDLAVERSLALNDMAIKIFHTYIQPLMNDTEADETMLLDLKTVFGNATILDLLFAQNISGSTENTTYRYVITRYTDIMQEAKHFYNERLLYWTKFTNTLL
jgi:hypothetical protein